MLVRFSSRLFIAILCGFIFASTTSRAQLLSPLCTPPQSADAPEWTRFLYTTPLNLLRLDSAYDAYYQTHSFEKNNYTKCYKRLRRLTAPFMNAQGELPITTPDMVYAPATNKTAHVAASQTWTPMGPFETWQPSNGTKPPYALPWQANTYAFDIAPSNPNVLYAVTETAGFFKSTDKGLHWTMLESGVYSSSEAVAVHPTNADVVYVGISGGIIKSVDGGKNWSSVWKLANVWIYDIELHANNPSLIYAATNMGFYRSSDGGASWQMTLTNTCCELETNPTNHNMVYTLRLDDAKKHYEFWKSTDGGLNFSIRSTGWLNTIGSTGAGRMTVTPANPNRIYAVLLSDSARPFILRSDDAGETWRISCRGNTDSLKMTNGQGYYDLSIAASHTNADQLIVGTTTAYRSTDGGSTFPVAIGGYTGTFSLHPDIQEMKVLGNDCYVATDGGFNYSNDLFDKNWESRINGLNGSDFWGFDEGWNEDVLVGGRYHNGNTVWREGYGNAFLRLGGGEAATGYVNPMRARHTYFSDIGGVDVPTDNSGTTSSFSVGLWPNESYYPMEYSSMKWDPRCATVVWIGRDSSVYRSDNDAKSFTKMWSSSDKGAEIQHIEIARSNPKVMYVVQRSNTLYDGKIWKSVDEGKTWTALANIPNTSASERRVMTIAVSGSNENVVFAALQYSSADNKIFKSTDGGKSWQNLTTPTISSYTYTDMVLQYGTKDGVYIAGSYGHIYYRNADMSDWALLNTGLHYAHQTRALKIFYRDNKLRSASNLGIWEVPLYEHSKPEAQPMVDKRSTACERDTFYFDDYSALEQGSAHPQWHWSFPGAIWVSDSTIRNPKVIYAKAGQYTVSLEVRNDYGSSVKTLSSMIEVLPSICGLDTRVDKALNMSSTKDLGTIGVIPSLKTNRGFTVSCWIKLDTIQQSFSQILSNWSSDVGFALGFSFQGYKANTNLTFYWKNVPYQLTSPFNLPIDEWVHVAISVESDHVTLYANGVPWVYRNTNADFAHFDLSATPWELGGALPGQGGNFRGQLDELRIYRRALDSNEIRSQMHLIYQPGFVVDTVVFPEPVAYYQFNETNTQRFYDRVGTAHMDNSGMSQVASTAPVAIGSSITATMNSGTKTFSPFADISRSASDAQRIVITRLDAMPDSIPTAKTFSPGYWIIHNYGSKSLSIDSMSLFYVGQISRDDEQNPSHLTLWKRSVNSHKNSWQAGPRVLHADSTTRRMTSASDTSAVAQYMLSTGGNSPLDVEQQVQTLQFSILPNPAGDIVHIMTLEHLPAVLEVRDAIGRLVYSAELNQPLSQISTHDWSSGVYTVELRSGGRHASLSLVVVH